MCDTEPKEPYVYYPFDGCRKGSIYGVAGPGLSKPVRGLSKQEAESLCAGLTRKLHARAALESLP
jgi:hypothetical protein